jgi:hypothetical protein
MQKFKKFLGFKKKRDLRRKNTQQNQLRNIQKDLAQRLK